MWNVGRKKNTNDFLDDCLSLSQFWHDLMLGRCGSLDRAFLAFSVPPLLLNNDSPSPFAVFTLVPLPSLV